MKESFNYMFFDNQFHKKAGLFLIYTILLIYCSIFSLTGCNNTIALNFLNYTIITLIVLFGYSVFEGYKITVIKSINISKENLQVLPMLNIKKSFILGIKFLISFLIFSIPFFCVIGAFGFTAGFATTLNMPSLLIYISSILLVLSISAYIIYLICFLPATIAIFAETNSIWNFYKFEKIFKLVFLNKKIYFKSALVYSILGIIIEESYRICLILNSKSLVISFIATLLSACIITYIAFIMCHIVAKINNNHIQVS